MHSLNCRTLLLGGVAGIVTGGVAGIVKGGVAGIARGEVAGKVTGGVGVGGITGGVGGICIDILFLRPGVTGLLFEFFA